MAHGRVVSETDQVLDHPFALLVRGVRLPGDHQLDRVLGMQQQCLQARGVAEHEGQALVGGHAAGETDGQDIRVEYRIGPRELGVGCATGFPGRAQAAPDVGHEVRAEAAAQRPDLGVGDVVHAGPVRVEDRLGAEVLPREIGDLGVNPGGNMDAVRHRGDRHLARVESRPQPREHATGHLAVQLRHAVGALGQAEAHHRHIELRRIPVGVVLGAERQDLVRRDRVREAGIEEVLDLCAVEAVDSRGNRGVRGEDGGGASRRQGFLPAHGGFVRRVHQFADALDAEEAGVALIGVEHLGGGGSGEPLEDAERLDAAHAEQQFLLQSLVPAPTVQSVGDVAGGFVIACHVRVEQEQRHAADVGAPDVGGQLPTVGERKDDLRCTPVRFAEQGQRQAVGVEDRVGFLLPGITGQGLLEVAGLVQQSDADQRHPEVGGRFQVVAGKDAEATGVLRQHGADAVLGGEVGDRAGCIIAECLIPAGRTEIAVEIGPQVLDPLDELLVGCQLAQLFTRHRAEK